MRNNDLASLSLQSKDLDGERNTRVKNVFDIQHGDARHLAATLVDNSVDVTITSPPYFDVKDYGVANQIGYGQDYNSYLKDLALVFGHVYRATKKRGSLWIIIDTFRRNQEVLALPFDLAARLKPLGWVLRDIIIWKKERTVPWSHQGSTKRIFEYILVLSKSSGPFRYFTDSQRDISDLKKWWVTYPERYNPRGKALEEIWNYDIPLQGSWGNRYIRHFCPLPAPLVARIIHLTTKKGDVVLDPFAGSGTVPANAHSLDRKYIGFELNKQFITMFRKYMRANRVSKIETPAKNGHFSAKQFQKLILELRILKFARLLFRSSEKHFGANTISHVLVRKLKKEPALPQQICSAEYVICLRKPALKHRLAAYVEELKKTRPLSKFGVSASTRITIHDKGVPATYRKSTLFLYSSTNSHQFARRARFQDAIASTFPVISTISASVEIPGG